MGYVIERYWADAGEWERVVDQTHAPTSFEESAAVCLAIEPRRMGTMKLDHFRVRAELARYGLRPAGENEPGWYVLLESGERIWATEVTS